MRRRRLAGCLLAAGLLAGACGAPPPVAEEKPKRKSFEEANAWTPSSGPAAGSDSTADARAVEDKWEQVRQTSDPAERQRLANEALRDTRALADAPAGQ